MRKWKLFVIAAMCLVFLFGLGLLLYPYVHGARVDREITDTAQVFLDRVETRPTQPDAGKDNPPVQVDNQPQQEAPRPYPELWEAMNAYNARVWEERQKDFSNAWAYEQPSFRLTDYGVEDEIFGVITIPAMDLQMPIYLGATYDHMAAGTAHLTQTSLPIGGTDTNCVIVGHRGWRGAPYFRYIDQVQIGDMVTITNLWETLIYKVVEIKIVTPYDTDAVLIQPGRDLLTLCTCHPYASGGRQRYLVFCERVA